MQSEPSTDTMGLPQADDVDLSGFTIDEEPTASEQTSRPSHLPPEALALATKLFDLARQGETSHLSEYLTAGIPANLTNHKGDTLLMLAAYHGHLDTVTMLLDNGADMDVLNERGQSPVAGAVFKGYDEIVKTMAERGADLAAGQPNAIEAAHMFNRHEMLKLFGVQEESGS